MASPNLSDKSTTVKPPMLLDQVRDKLRVKRYSIHTEQTYLDWIKCYISFHDKNSTSKIWRRFKMWSVQKLTTLGAPPVQSSCTRVMTTFPFLRPVST